MCVYKSSRFAYFARYGACFATNLVNGILSKYKDILLRCSSFITLCLGSIIMDCVISETCYKGTILQKKYRKMTILWSFSYNSFVKLKCSSSYNSFVKLHGKRIRAWFDKLTVNSNSQVCILTTCT